MIHMVPGEPEVLPGMKNHYGFDKPLYQQYILWTGKLLKGDLGESITKPGMSVADGAILPQPGTRHKGNPNRLYRRGRGAVQLRQPPLRGSPGCCL